MKHTDLKVGDYFAPTDHPKPSERIVWEYLGLNAHGKPRGRVARDGTTVSHQIPRFAGHTFWLSDADVRPIELVPMPGPYVVGKEYRTRDGKRATYTGKNDNVNRNYCPHGFQPSEGAYFSTQDSGRYTTVGDADENFDVMGEWREETATTSPGPILGHQYNQTTGEIEPILAPGVTMDAKRTLPTVTLDQVFETLKEKGACWYKDLGPTALVRKLDGLGLSGIRGGYDLRSLGQAVALRSITVSDAGWLINNMGPALTPRDLNATGQTIGTPAFSQLLNEWENPKPKQTMICDLKPGTQFVQHGQRYTVVDPVSEPLKKAAYGSTYVLRHMGGLLTSYGPSAPLLDPSTIILPEPK